jgi:ribosomal protein S18 acetylase RimI-like enzyme
LPAKDLSGYSGPAPARWCGNLEAWHTRSSVCGRRHRVIVAVGGTGVVGYGEVQFNAWNQRAEIENLAVSADFRGLGIGRALVQAIDQRARREPSARCLWLETQNLNYPAVQFYLRMGFRLCGLDETLYDPGMPGLLPGEIALYFVRDLDPG